MVVLDSHVDPTDPTFQSNRDRMQQLVTELENYASSLADRIELEAK